MTQDRGALREIAWRDIFPGIILARALRLAVNVRVLTLAAVALVATTGGWRICQRAFYDEPNPVAWPWSAPDPSWLPTPFQTTQALQEARLREFQLRAAQGSPSDATLIVSSQVPTNLPFTDDGLATPHAPALPNWWSASPLTRTWTSLSSTFRGLFDQSRSLKDFTFLLLCGLWSLLVWSLFGGAITRLAAVSLAREEQLAWGQVFGYARSKLGSYFAAPLFPILAVMGAALPLAILGLFLRSGIGTFIAAILWPLVLVAGVFMAVLLVGLFFGFPLMWTTISSEGTDSFDALSRSYAYTYQRPLHYFFYAVVAAALGILGWIVVDIFAWGIIEFGLWGVSWGSNSENLMHILRHDESLSSAGSAGSSLILFWIGLIRTLQMAFAYSYFWTASTAIYLLLRRHVDATELDEVFVAEDEETFGLPPLKADAAGVPLVDDAPAGASASPEG